VRNLNWASLLFQALGGGIGAFLAVLGLAWLIKRRRERKRANGS
jgi:uncharacterized protein (TIGR03382 family)